MNTTRKGDKFEKKIYVLMQNLISSGKFYVQEKYAKVFSKKGYFSKDRKKNIIFDVSIEVYLPSQDTYSHLILIECKDYSHKVGVDDVEEFFAKAQQISAANIKAIIASTNSFQEGAFNFSESKGIGLLRYFDKDKLKWELTRSPSSQLVGNNEAYYAREGLTRERYESPYFDCYCFIDNSYTNSLNMFVLDLIRSNLSEEDFFSLMRVQNLTPDKTSIVKYIKQEDIAVLCTEVHNKINYTSGEVSLELVCEWLSDKHNLKLVNSNTLDPYTLGKITFNPLVIHLNNNESDHEGRKRFTLAHEIGHYLLGHGQYMQGEICSVTDVNLENTSNVEIQDVARMEVQANYFASFLLVPDKALYDAFDLLYIKHGLRNRGTGSLYLDDQKCNIDNFYNITDDLKERFNVSRKVVEIRLIKLGILKITENEGTKPLSSWKKPVDFLIR